MKNLIVLVVIFFVGQAFSQKNRNDTIVFEFKNKLDTVIYRIHKGKKEVSGFNILIGEKKIYFSLAINNNFKKENFKNTKTRFELEQMIKNDNPKKHYVYLIIYKNRCYSADYIFRVQECQ